jgi:2-polyprenyl-3-methyl-5-hydroxy-6-metoxy-1,4-benzoquinol methylase
MISYQHCPVCNSNDIVEVLTAIDYTVSHEKFSIWQCNACSLRFTQSVPDANGIGRYYQSAEYISHSDTKKGMVNSLYHLVRNFTLQQKKGLVIKKSGLSAGTLLDVGCGTGAFLSVMKEGGWQVKGLEPDEKARGLARQKGLDVDDASTLFSLSGSSFNVITLWHVLEHVHELHAYMDQLRKLLRPNGVLFVAVPNYTSGDAGHYSSSWAAYDVPRHLYHFSPASMQKLLSLHEMKTIDILPMWFDSFYVSMLSEKYKGGSIISAFLQGSHSNIKAAGNHQRCSSVIYVIKAV